MLLYAPFLVKSYVKLLSFTYSFKNHFTRRWLAYLLPNTSHTAHLTEFPYHSHVTPSYPYSKKHKTELKHSTLNQMPMSNTLLPGRNYYRMRREQHSTMANATINNKTLLIFQSSKTSLHLRAVGLCLIALEGFHPTPLCETGQVLY